MASSLKDHDVVLRLDSSSCDDEEDVDEEEEEDDDDDTLPVNVKPPPAPASTTVTIALPAAPPSSSSASLLATTAIIAADPISSAQRKPMPIPMDDSRKLFQRLWTDEDEIELLQGFLEYSSQRGLGVTRGGTTAATHNHGQYDTALFYDQIRSRLQLDFNKNQLVEKLRRLKKKYRNVIGKISSGKEFSFKSPHDQATFEISRKIWVNIAAAGLDDDETSPSPLLDVKPEDLSYASRSKKRSRPKAPPPPATAEERRVFFDHSHPPGIANHASNGDVRGLVEEAVRSCLSPLIKELSGAGGGGPSTAGRGFAVNTVPVSMNLGMFGELAAATAVVAGDERWRRQQILELEVYSKRLELVQDQIKAALDDLRSRGL